MLPDHKKIVYLPQTEYRLITALYDLTCNGIYYCSFKKYFDTLENKFNKIPDLYQWYEHTRNAYFDLAISNWCKLFGAYSEPTHYYHLISTHALKSKLMMEQDQVKHELAHHYNIAYTDQAFAVNHFHPRRIVGRCTLALSLRCLYLETYQTL